MSPRLDDDGKRKFLEIAQQTANALAADRSTKFLPIIVAQIFFISTIAIAFGRAPAAASGKNPSTYINIEVHSVGFSALYFWVIPTVILGSVIGVSQTENAIPRILRRFQKDINHTFPDLNDRLPNDHINGPDNSEIPATCIRERHGGIYSWRPSHIRRSHVQWLEGRRESRPCGKSRNNSTFRRFRHFFSLRPGSLACAQLLVFASLATGVIISVLVPPVGYGCRGIGETAIILAWILNGFLDSIPIPNQHLEFWLTFIRDLITTLATLIGIAVTQVGVFNQCSCFTLWGLTGLEIPQDVSVDAALQYGIKTIYPAIAFLGIVLQLVIFPGIIICQYSRALRVFLSRDDNTSNAPWWYSIRACFGYKHLPTSVATPCPPGSHADPDSVDAVDAVDVDGHSLMLSQYPSHT